MTACEYFIGSLEGPRCGRIHKNLATADATHTHFAANDGAGYPRESSFTRSSDDLQVRNDLPRQRKRSQTRERVRKRRACLCSTDASLQNLCLLLFFFFVPELSCIPNVFRLHLRPTRWKTRSASHIHRVTFIPPHRQNAQRLNYTLSVPVFSFRVSSQAF